MPRHPSVPNFMGVTKVQYMRKARRCWRFSAGAFGPGVFVTGARATRYRAGAKLSERLTKRNYRSSRRRWASILARRFRCRLASRCCLRATSDSLGGFAAGDGQRVSGRAGLWQRPWRRFRQCSRSSFRWCYRKSRKWCSWPTGRTRPRSSARKCPSLEPTTLREEGGALDMPGVVA